MRPKLLEQPGGTTWGHGMGDRLLKAVAERVRAAVAALRVDGDDGALSCIVSIGDAALAPGLSWEGGW